MKYIIGIDLGTQGTKTALYDQAGNSVADAFEPSNLIYGENGRVEQDLDEMLGSCLRTVKNVMEQSAVNPADVATLTIDGQMAGITAVDKDGNGVIPYDSWLDQRCAKYFKTLRDWGEEKYIGIGGNAVTYAHGPKILWWKHEYPEIFARIDKFIQPSAYCVMQMCGLKAADAFVDYTFLHFASFASVEHKQWSVELMDAFEIPAEKFPEIVKPWKLVGRLTKEMAGQCGLLEGMPIAAGCGDTAANSFGGGITRPGLMYDVGGTASTLAVAVDRYVPDVEGKMLKFAAAVVEGLYLPHAYMNGAGMCLPWFKDEILGGDGRDYSYEELNDRAAAIEPGSNSLLFIPHFAGRVCPNNQYLRGTWLKLNWDHTKAHMYRSIMESIAYEYRIYLDRIKALLPHQEFEQIIAVGGAAKSPLFRQIKSDILGLPEVTLNRADTATLGVAVIGGYAVGMYDDLAKAIDDINEFVDRTEPNPQMQKVYDPYVRAYEMSLDYMTDYYKQLERILP